MSSAPTARPRHHRGWWIAAIIVVLLIGWSVWHRPGAKPAHAGAAPQVVSAARVVSGSMPEQLAELGTVTPISTVNVLPQLSGYLTAVGYQEGQQVSQGQFLAQIDPRQYEIDKQQAQAQLAKDQASLAQARADLVRYTELHQRQSIAEQTFADQRFTVQQAEAAVQADRASIAQYELDLAYCHITAPIAGRVGLRLVDPGNYVTQSSSPGIVTITSIKPTTVQFSVPQNELGKVLQRLRAGGKLSVAAYDADNNQLLASGTLYAAGNQMATSTGTVSLRAMFANDDERLFPNEFVNVRLLVDTLQQAVLVPTPAVQSGAPGDYVYLIDADHTVSVRKVSLGPSDGRQTVILAGLTVGQQVVVDGMDRLSDGAKVKLAPEAPAGAGSAPAAATTARPARRAAVAAAP